MTSYDAGDTVLVHYPFTDLTASKKRPAVILSPRIYTDRFGDVVAVARNARRKPGLFSTLAPVYPIGYT